MEISTSHSLNRITSYNVCYTKLLRFPGIEPGVVVIPFAAEVLIVHRQVMPVHAAVSNPDDDPLARVVEIVPHLFRANGIYPRRKGTDCIRAVGWNRDPL